jgi:elongation factor G
VPIGAEEKFAGRGRPREDEGHLLGRRVAGHEVRHARHPGRLADVCKEWREKMVESAAEANEEVMNKYLETGELSEAEIKAALRHRTIAGEIVPMLCGSAFKNKGVQAMLDAVIDYMPAPTDIRR